MGDKSQLINSTADEAVNNVLGGSKKHATRQWITLHNRLAVCHLTKPTPFEILGTGFGPEPYLAFTATLNRYPKRLAPESLHRAI